ncbi:MAG: superoxide dismutase [Ni] [Verrucomicrobia bacterium]|nr:superoxide dismutase [Ni] [Verrucomicrobiota bacterium]
MNIRHLTALAATALTFLSLAPRADAHCQIPCGIYNDNNVLESMQTDWLTIQKASTQIIDLSKDPAANAQQLTRWVVNKETHAQNIQHKVLNYFLAQRLKTDDPDKDAYLKKLTLCHKIIVTAMQCKQSTDAANVEALEKLLQDFTAAFGTKK